MTSPRYSAGLLPYLVDEEGTQVFLGHMGGPFWARKDEASWSVVKGMYDPSEEDALSAAKREFREEIGVEPPAGEALSLGELRASRKLITVYAVPSDSSLAYVGSNVVSIEWPPRSGRTVEFPETDRAAWIPLEEARRLIVRGQLPILDRLEHLVDPGSPGVGAQDDVTPC